MECEECGKVFQPSGHGSRQRYCSKSCRQKAAYRRKKNGVSAEGKPRRGAKPKPKRKPVAPPILDRHEFDRMMDCSREDTLREIVARLREALHDPATPANTLAPIASKLAEFDEKMRMAGESGGLFDSADDESVEVSEDVGASIV